MNDNLAYFLLFHLGTILVDILIISVLGHMLHQRREPTSMIAWLLAIILLPYVAVPLYFIFRSRKLKRKRKQKASVLSSKTLKERMLTLQFREDKNGKLKNITVRAKQARGLFASHIIQSAMKNPADLKTISLDGYTYSKTLSSRLEWFFTR